MKTVTVTETPAAAELEAMHAETSKLRGDIARQRGVLRDLEQRISAAKHTIARSTIPGDGTYLVGKEIKPGTYRSVGHGSGCYYSRLSSLDDSGDNIISNSIDLGPILVVIAPSDKAFQVRGCSPFRRVG